MNKQITKLKQLLCSVMQILKKTFPAVIYYMLGTLIHQNWFPIVWNAVPKLNMYMRLYHNVCVLQINGYVVGKHLEHDKIHLSAEGYHLFISKALGPLLDGFFNRIRPKKETKPHHQMTKAQKKRFIHNQHKKKM